MNILPDRRGFFSWGLRGLGATALIDLLAHDAQADPLPHFAPKAKRAVHIALVGGMSHIDSFDHKPGLTKRHGQSLKTDSMPDIFFGQVGLLRKADFEFRQRGKSGLWMSDLFPHLTTVADELTIINSMYSDSANHTPALFLANSGFQPNGFPPLGSWLSYGLGCVADDLPAYVVLPDGRGEPNGAASNWTSGFLPARHQGVVFRGGKEPVRDLLPARPVAPAEEAATREFLQHANELHLERSGAEADLLARVRAYELAAKMQLAVPRAADLSGEAESVRRLYGLDKPGTADCGGRCLLARRLLERGVRFVQIFCGGPIGGSPRTSWDAHENVRENHSIEAARIDQPATALLIDLKRRGMLNDTLVLFTTEFGRTPFTQSAAGTVGPGRDHNRYGFSCWLAGAGLRKGIAYGATDDVGWKAAEKPVNWHDFHATVLHLLGINHERLTFYHNGIRRRLTNVHGQIISGIVR